MPPADPLAISMQGKHHTRSFQDSMTLTQQQGRSPDEQGSQDSSLAAIFATQPSASGMRFRYTIGVLPEHMKICGCGMC